MASSVARTLRRNPTDAEQRLWSLLRRRQLDGFKFRRQVPFGPYVVDFACLSARLIVEVDGGQHDWEAARDETRTARLTAEGFRVVRFWNNEVLVNTEGVVERIREALATPLPDPPPQGGRESVPIDSSRPRLGARPSKGSLTTPDDLPPPFAGEGWGGERG